MRSCTKLFPWSTNFGHRSRRFPRRFAVAPFRPPAGRMVISIWRLLKLSTALPRPVLPRRSNSFLGLKQVAVVVQEFFYFVFHAQYFGPLFLVERDREPADSVKRYRPLFAHFQTQPTHTLVFQLIVFRTQPL